MAGFAIQTTPTFLLSILTLTFFLATLPQSYSQENDTYSICSQSFSCGTLSNISYPFWGGNRPQFCGRDGFKLACMHNQSAWIQVGSQKFNVLNLNQTASTLRMVRRDLVYDHCSSNFTNTTLSAGPFSFLPTVQNVTVFYKCPSGNSIVGNTFTCWNDSSNAFYVVNGTQLKQFPGLGKCGLSVQVQVSEGVVWDSEGGVGALEKALDHGFDVGYDAEWSSQCTACRESGGACGTNENDSAQFSCYCSAGTRASVCSTHESGRKKRVLKLVLGFVATGFALPLIAVIICRNKARLWKFILTQFGKIKRNDQIIEAFLVSQGSIMGLKRYRFSDVKKMTDSFKIKLGEGGYGSVYKGKLLDGCSVAVKILNESKENGEEFINEVASISKTSHVNIVSLLGFCLEGTRKALVYEFMFNGSLEKYIHKKAEETESQTTTPSLSWERLHQIAIGIARGLEYLHKGCNTRILHFDIKPHNILLDETYRPKISDFGLAKLSTRDESIISMSNARGTIGYVAPEVFNKSFGGVSHKSDVYSYGMMLLEMVGGQKNMDVEGSQSSEIYFPQLVIYKKLEQSNDLGLDGILSSEENEMAKRMTMVSLWCIQTIPSHRPTISRVIDMLEGTVDSLEMPPKPFLFSPPRSAPGFSTASVSLDSV
ncbi:LEAF RUST 10 DISEASE-RESISTANCE LOCUS RECEPTOR-LIKE PROTEIN KINASE-like 2.1, partial [Mucuna pruriens]